MSKNELMTGVGVIIAIGNQVEKGIWVLLVKAII